MDDFEEHRAQDERFIGTDRDAQGALRTCLMIQSQFNRTHGPGPRLFTAEARHPL